MKSPFLVRPVMLEPDDAVDEQEADGGCEAGRNHEKRFRPTRLKEVSKEVVGMIVRHD